MIDNLLELTVFARVVSAGSLSAAARELDLSLAVVSKRLTALETRLGVRLLQRTTRRQSLTEEGTIFHARCVRILAEVEEAEAAVSHTRDTVTGVLRITAPRGFGRRRIAPLAVAFQALHPELRVHLVLTDALVNLVEEGMDLAVRFGRLADSSLIARQLAPNFRVVCAAPSYLARHGFPSDPAALATHHCIVFGEHPTSDWHFQYEGAAIVAHVRPTFVTNDGETAQTLALEGAGIVIKSIWDVGDDIAAGRLVRLLPDYTISAAPLQAVYANAQHLAPRVRRFVEFCSERLREEWHWD
ncbi:LysR family transcriptional regulator [Luteibacter rhizovicinus]|uniref:LysR family transcriptional regulator n=1 Tax=Luteibacter rhizovicinus TaxID=242606 RepID=A0A4R3YPB6_9GAMM|nr:LysR family transcriptional regulator [Luteibacter rhizovicinus]TCV92753.1 LysR family transcriptional regulator [Luteibacter rhizovicinus]